MSEGIKAAKLCWKFMERNVELTAKLGHEEGGEHPSLQCSALFSAGILECFDYRTFNIECMMKYIL